MAAEVVFLTGAPDVDSLHWTDDNLISAFEPPIQRFLGESVPQKSTSTTTQTSFSVPRWRALSLLPAPVQHRHEAERDRDRAKFVSFQDAPGPASTRDMEHLNFLEHSLAVLQDLDSSQIEVPDGTFVDDTTAFTSESFNSTFVTDQSSLLASNDSLSTYSTQHPEQQIVSFSGPFTDLKHIPTARYLRSLHPQTMTVNILAAVISVQPARTVRLRKRAGEMDVIEILLGDETRAGFSVSFWVTPVDSQTTTRSAAKDVLRQMLDSLRTGAVVLLTHIALADYQNNVSGQSLSRRITRNNTTLTVLSDNVTGLSVPVTAKMQRVRAWAKDFVGSGSTKRAASQEAPAVDRRASRVRLELPPETQTQYR